MMTRSHNLEAISDQEQKRPTAMNRRRVPRLNLATEQFRLNVNGKVFSVANLSMDGMGIRILDEEDLIFFIIGSVVPGTLSIHREKVPVHLQIRHIRRDMIGGQFENLSEQSAVILRNFLDPGFLGRELRPLQTNEKDLIWYHGPSGTEFFLWRGVDGQYYQMVLLIYGNFIQWAHEKGLLTGRAAFSHEASEIQGVFRLETVIFDQDETIDFEKLDIAKLLILSSNLPHELKKWCERHLEVQNGS